MGGTKARICDWRRQRLNLPFRGIDLHIFYKCLYERSARRARGARANLNHLRVFFKFNFKVNIDLKKGMEGFTWNRSVPVSVYIPGCLSSRSRSNRRSQVAPSYNVGNRISRVHMR